jgi:GNAT superfamily N-acetyltransferase
VAATTALTIRRAADPDDAALPAVERLYVEAFPAVERKPVAWLRSLARPVAGPSLLLIAERGSDVVGFAVVFAPPNPADAALLEYLAVTEPARGGGVGGRLFEAVVRSVARPLLVEVKTGDDKADRRLAFYQRHGCRVVGGLAYQLPLPGRQPPMSILVAGVEQFARPTLHRWLTAVYVGAYGQQPTDPRLAAMVAPLDDPVRLGPLLAAGPQGHGGHAG